MCVLENEEHEPADLNINGDDYEPNSLRVMIAALDRHLQDKHYLLSIVKDCTKEEEDLWKEN